MSRRHLLAAGGFAGAGLLLSACGATSGSSSQVVGPTSTAVARVEAQRRRSGRITNYTLDARPTQIDLGGPIVSTWAYGDTVPGPIIRANPGDEMRIQVNNMLPTDTSVHWHGLAIQNDMDGVPPVTQKAIPAGSGMLYHYVVPDPGTYWYHPHVGLQEDRGLYGPLIVDDPSESGAYDVEFVVVLDDWVDGIAAQTPETVYTGLRSDKGTGGSGMSMGSSTAGSPLGADADDVAYQYYLINGKIPSAPVTLAAKPGQRARFRIINSAARRLGPTKSV